VLDLSCEPPRALRPGMIHREALMAVIGPVENQSSQAREPLKSPGSLQKHYSPRAPLIIRNWKNEEDLRIQLAQSGLPISKTHVIAHTNIPCSLDWGCVNVIPHDPEAFARAIYAQLHECDDEGAELIVVEALPETNEWRALRDRLNRAAAT